MKYPSSLVERAVEQLSSLPGIGRKTALRLALYILANSKDEARALGTSIIDMREHIVYCQCCHNISDTELCSICANPSRDASLVCVVQNVADVMAIENTGQYRGLYHVLGGVISPIDGIGPESLQIDSLMKRINEGEIKEIILALGTTMEGDTTNFFIHRSLTDLGLEVKISIIARGVAIGDEIEYADELTLGRSILSRTNFEDSFAL